MPQNGILHEGVAALAEAFKSNPNLKVGQAWIYYAFISNGYLLYTDIDDILVVFLLLKTVSLSPAVKELVLFYLSVVKILILSW